MHIAIAGNIGSGKTILAGLLAKHYGWEVHYESADTNPYLSDFYDDMKRWSFALQIYFLSNRLKQAKDIQSSGKDFIQDRTIYEDAYIFAPGIAEVGMMSKRDYDSYLSLFKLMSSLVNPPGLLIYLRAEISTLVKYIQHRGRNYESNIRIDYLSELNERYEKWINTYDLGKLLIVDVNRLDIVNKPQDLSIIISKIDAEIHGLF